jgi:hypothetical protein
MELFQSARNLGDAFERKTVKAKRAIDSRTFDPRSIRHVNSSLLRRSAFQPDRNRRRIVQNSLSDDVNGGRGRFRLSTATSAAGEQRSQERDQPNRRPISGYTQDTHISV